MALQGAHVDRANAALVRSIESNNPDGVHPERDVESRLGGRGDNLQAFTLLSKDNEPVSVVYAFLKAVQPRRTLQETLTQVSINDILSAQIKPLEQPPTLALCYSITNNPNAQVKGVAPLLISYAKAALDSVVPGDTGVIVSSISPNWTYARWLKDKGQVANYIGGSTEARLALNARHLADGVRNFKDGQRSSLSHAARLHLSNGAAWAATEIRTLTDRMASAILGDDRVGYHRDVLEGMGTKNFFMYSDGGVVNTKINPEENIRRFQLGELPIIGDLIQFVR